MPEFIYLMVGILLAGVIGYVAYLHKIKLATGTFLFLIVDGISVSVILKIFYKMFDGKYDAVVGGDEKIYMGLGCAGIVYLVVMHVLKALNAARGKDWDFDERPTL
ncbi:hypothetical protein ACFFJ4_00600 [Xanthomonas dyei]|uniref:Uncharacterized protein n=1 Tax=Xanthomonas floridensis TaxID=1843580 RepID=A0ABU5Q3D5_9XANT|nr:MULTISPECIES: hypothetical protein [Xanthomonas]MEA5126212.1 hypothetical protein [Xanthomonas floridensis]MEA5134122.1 hypothetical protein [Xanthomonas floridensis]